jgi:hypothetical protein
MAAGVVLGNQQMRLTTRVLLTRSRVGIIRLKETPKMFGKNY